MDNRQRLLSLDALRGFDMVWLIGLAAAVRAFCGAFPGGDEGLCEHAAGHPVLQTAAGEAR